MMISIVQLGMTVAVIAALTCAHSPNTETLTCHSFTVNHTAVKHIVGGENPPQYGLTSTECAQACCALGIDLCNVWTHSPGSHDSSSPASTCFLKNASATTLAHSMIQLTQDTSGCINHACPPVSPAPPPAPTPPMPPPAPTPVLPPSLVRPRLRVVGTIAQQADARLRDPTTALFDPVTTSWHIWLSHKPLWASREYTTNVTIWHFVLHSADINADELWEPTGPALNATHIPGAFDADAVYTPGAAVECHDGHGGKPVCEWFLWFGAVNNQGPLKNESIGVSMSSSPFGPWSRYEHNPVFTPVDANAGWCAPDGVAARVDEIKPLVLRGSRYLAVKCVCQNFTGLPVFYSPVNQSSWGPPYVPSREMVALRGNLTSPMFVAARTCGGKGIEEPTFFIGPDGFLHFLGHNHGSCASEGSNQYQHFYRTNRNASTDAIVNALDNNTKNVTINSDIAIAHGNANANDDEWHDGGHFAGEMPDFPWHEPNPIPRDGSGVFGDRTSTGVPEFWIDFGQWNQWATNITLCAVEWVNASLPSLGSQPL
eukprot:m.166647 g.166647  ORF g.166647 m.166647 type:complete len:542 (+) comp31436_c1_seq1:202-1827(+)